MVLFHKYKPSQFRSGLRPHKSQQRSSVMNIVQCRCICIKANVCIGRAKRHGLAYDHDVRVVFKRKRVQEYVHEVSAGQAWRDFGLHGLRKRVVHDQHAAGCAEFVHNVVQRLVPRPHPRRLEHHAFQVRAQTRRAGIRLADCQFSDVQIPITRESQRKRTRGPPLFG